MGKYSEFTYYHICLPISASCGISMYQSTWLPWDPEKKEIWLNQPPEQAITLENHPFDFFKIGMKDYLFQKKLSRWLHQKNKPNEPLYWLVFVHKKVSIDTQQ
ncbi:hypothetical protein ACE4ZB_013930 [Enterococcus faecalis]